MTVPTKRKKAFSPKVRTGCATCRTRRIKCDEAKPECIRCRRRGIECAYPSATTWIFEPGSTKDKNDKKPPGKLEMQKTPTQTFYSREERQALEFWTSRTAPWMAEHGKHPAKDFWTKTLPKMYHAVPATRHLIAALGLLEMPNLSADSFAIERRSQRINYHYTLALRELTKPAPHFADIALGPILAWLLEALMNNGPRAAIHANAAEQLSTSRAKGNDALPREELDLVVADLVRARCMRSRCDVTPSESSYIHEAVRVRSIPVEKPSAADIRLAFEQFYDTFHPESMTTDDVAEAEAFISRWEAAILANVYRSDEPSMVWSALHFLCVLSAHVLPTPISVYFPSSAPPPEHGLDFSLEKCELLIGIKLSRRVHQRAVQETANLMIHVMRSFASPAWQASQKDRLIQAASINRTLLRELHELDLTTASGT